MSPNISIGPANRLPIAWRSRGSANQSRSGRCFGPLLETLKNRIANPLISIQERGELAECLYVLGDANYQLGDMVQAEASFRQCVDLYRKNLAAVPTETAYRLRMGHACRMVGFTIRRISAAGRCGDSFADAETAFRQLQAESPGNAEYSHFLSDTSLHLGVVLGQLHRSKEAETAIQNGIRVAEKLAAEAPQNEQWRIDCGHALWKLGDLYDQQNRPDDAENTFRRAAEVFDKLAAEFPKNRYNRLELGYTHWQIGWLMKKLGRPARAEGAFRAAKEINAKLSVEAPQDEEYRKRWMNSAVEDCRLLLAQKKYREAEAVALESSQIDPKTWFANRRAASYIQLSMALLKDDAKLSAADRKTFEESAQSDVSRILNAAGKPRAENANEANNLAWELVTQSDAELNLPITAVELSKTAVELAPKVGIYWNTLGVAQYRAGDWKASEAAFQNGFKFRDGGDSYDWFFLAMTVQQLGQKEQARKWHDAARLWMAKNAAQNDDLKRFSAEAAALLGIEQQLSLKTSAICPSQRPWSTPTRIPIRAGAGERSPKIKYGPDTGRRQSRWPSAGPRCSRTTKCANTTWPPCSHVAGTWMRMKNSVICC